MTARQGFGRRPLLTMLAGGASAFTLGFAWPNDAQGQAPRPAPGRLGAFIAIDAQGVVTLQVPSLEMGQGTSTAMPMLLAEELDADWSLVRFALAPAADAFLRHDGQRQMTGAAVTVKERYLPLRQAGATARAMLVQAAAARWRVPVASCSTQPGQVVHAASGRKLGYGALAAEAAQLAPPADVPLKPEAQFRLLGQAVRRLDVPAKVNGSATYGIDVKLPGQLAAAVRRSPAHGGHPRLRNRPNPLPPGVRGILEVPGGLAVVADSHWRAKQVLAGLDIRWEGGANFSQAGLEQRLHDGLAREGVVMERIGDQGLHVGDNAIEADYFVPLLHHACMEPPNCTARLADGRLEVWSGTQEPTLARALAAQLSGLPLEQVTLHTVLAGGGFGRRYERDEVAQAVMLAKALGAPVQVLWSREEDFAQGYYRPAAAIRLRARLGPDGLPLGLLARVCSASLLARAFPDHFKEGRDTTSVYGLRHTPYAFGGLRVEFVHAPAPRPMGFMRSVSYGPCVFAMEGFIDRLAQHAGADPLAYRRRLLAGSPRALAVLDKVAAMSGWGGPVPAGRARGVAVHEIDGAFCAQVVEASAPAGQPPVVHQVWAAVDCGRVVHPDGALAQMQGGILFGLSNTLAEAITVKDGAVEQANFDSYQVLRLDQAPAVQVALMESTQPPLGIGEAGVPGVGAALANALGALTGHRPHRLPLA